MMRLPRAKYSKCRSYYVFLDSHHLTSDLLLCGDVLCCVVLCCVVFINVFV
jgi:hypothetical protein